MVDIAYAPPEARAEVVQFMHDSFPRAKWGLAGWTKLLDGRWSTPDAPFAITARDQGELVGVLGMIPATRQTSLGPRTIASLTSWYLLKPYRGQGVGRDIMAMATGNPQITATNLSSARDAIPVVLRAGMTVLDSKRLIWRASDRSARRLPFTSDPLSLGRGITQVDRQVLKDHDDLNLKSLCIETPDGPCVIVLSVKRKDDAFVTHEVMYIGAPAVFAQHVRAIADTVLPPQGAVLAVDRRFMPEDAQPDAVVDIPVPRYYTPGRVPPNEVDHLYSEIVLMDMKLY